CNAGGDRRVELLNDIVRRASGRADPVPAACRVSRHKFRNSGNLWRSIRTSRSSNPNRNEFGGSDVLDDLRDRSKSYRYLSTKEIGHVTSFIRHLDHIDASHHLEQLAGDMRSCPEAGRGYIDLARICLRKVDHLWHGFNRK